MYVLATLLSFGLLPLAACIVPYDNTNTDRIVPGHYLFAVKGTAPKNWFQRLGYVHPTLFGNETSHNGLIIHKWDVGKARGFSAILNEAELERFRQCDDMVCCRNSRLFSLFPYVLPTKNGRSC
jgi:hypothetical protein